MLIKALSLNIRFTFIAINGKYDLKYELPREKIIKGLRKQR